MYTPGLARPKGPDLRVRRRRCWGRNRPSGHHRVSKRRDGVAARATAPRPAAAARWVPLGSGTPPRTDGSTSPVRHRARPAGRRGRRRADAAGRTGHPGPRCRPRPAGAARPNQRLHPGRPGGGRRGRCRQPSKSTAVEEHRRGRRRGASARAPTCTPPTSRHHRRTPPPSDATRRRERRSILGIGPRRAPGPSLSTGWSHKVVTVMIELFHSRVGSPVTVRCHSQARPGRGGPGRTELTRRRRGAGTARAPGVVPVAVPLMTD